jgi:replicative DNA helicase Mcm
MKVSSTLIPRARYVTGRGVTGVGLTATVTRDEEFLGGWVLEAGALVLCNRSILMVDEFEKISKEDQIAFHESMEAQTISIAKASIVATLPAQTAILAGGNPKFGRFDPYLPIKEQIDISETLLSRFDLKFALRDIPNPTIDERMVDHMINSRHFEGKEIEPVIPPELLRKYVAYARKNCQPRLTEEAAKVLKEFYLDLRKKSEEGPIAITPRQLEALIRLSEASAKIQLRKEVGVEDAQRAINLMKSSLRQFGFEPETGMIDIDRAEGQRATAAQRGKIRTMLSIIDELTLAYGKQIPTEEIIKKAKDKGIDNPDEILKKMLNEGVCFSPKPGVIEKIV